MSAEVPAGARFRPNVAAILRDLRGRVLVGERLNRPGSWQFPQGGIDPGESAEQALYREVWEEVGIEKHSYHVLESRDGYRYMAPTGTLIKGGYHGQDQTWFLCELLHETTPMLDAGDVREFAQVRWVLPVEFKLEWVPDFKRGVYRRALKELLGIV